MNDGKGENLEKSSRTTTWRSLGVGSFLGGNFPLVNEEPGCKKKKKKKKEKFVVEQIVKQESARFERGSNVAAILGCS